MALRDPGLLEFVQFVATEEVATDFAREHGLLLTGQQVIGGGVGGSPPNPNSCALGTQVYNGTVNPGNEHRGESNKTYEGFSCNKCKRFRSTKNALIAGEVRASRNSGEFRSFFVSVSAGGKSHTKLSIQKALVIIYCWVSDMSLKQTRKMLDQYGNLILLVFYFFYSNLSQLLKRCRLCNPCRLAELHTRSLSSGFEQRSTNGRSGYHLFYRRITSQRTSKIQYRTNSTRKSNASCP